MIQTDKTLDIKGLAELRTETITGDTLEGMARGQVLTVITTDRQARRKLTRLCEHLGYTLLDFREDKGNLYVQIRK
jgi:TusA-related sulfurtransferase